MDRKRKTAIRDEEEDLFIKRVGKSIQSKAMKRKVSIERLAYEAGISKGYAYDIIKGKSNPSILILFRIASALEINPSELI